MATQYWQHNVSGEVWAVLTDNEGAVLGVTGPLHYSDVTVGNITEGNFNFDAEDAEDFDAHRDAYHVKEVEA